MNNPDSDKSHVVSLPVKIWRFYVDGFRGMGPLGRNLWLLIILKLFIFFVVMKLFFFPDLLQRDYDNDEERAQAVRNNLVSLSL